MNGRPIAWSLFVLVTPACVVGTIDGPPAPAFQRDGGASHGNDWDAEEDPGAPPPEDEPDAAPTKPDTKPADTGGGAPPPPSDGGGAPPPPSDGGGAPPPPSDSGAADTAPPPDTAPPSTTYPSGPYGSSVGSTFPNLSFNGYRDGTGSWVPVTMADYYDPTGARGITGVLIIVSASWCGPCQEEAKALPKIYPGYKARGARFLGGLIEDSYRNPATQKNVDSWIKAFSTNYDMVADGKSSLLPPGSVGIPYSIVVDPRTMKVSKTWSGADPSATSIPQLDTVIAKNGG
ncbi:MAG: redoxin domain-containing protein [Myxococcales bacterium]|nr:redoxin domain-containing protein [Myxococcales bacterium]